MGQALAGAGKTQEAIDALQSGLSVAVLDDWEYRLRASALLAQLFEKAGKPELAAIQYRQVLAQTYRPELRRQAEAFFERVR